MGVTPCASPANGIIVSLENSSAWTVNGESHITGLCISGDSAVKAPEGKKLTMSVNGVETAPVPGEYRGEILLTIT